MEKTSDCSARACSERLARTPLESPAHLLSSTVFPSLPHPRLYLCLYPRASMPPQATLPAPAVAATRKLHWSPPDATSSLRIRWGKLKRAIGTALPDEDPTNTETTSDAGSNLGWKATGTGEAKNSENEADDLVDEVVVDNSQTLGMWARVQPSSSTDGRAGETGTSPGTAGGDPRGGGGPSDSSSNRNTAFDVVSPLGKVGTFCRWRVWPVLV